MVKRRSIPKNVDRYMTEYRMRTSYATPVVIPRFNSGQSSTRSTHRHDAHERSHARLNPTEPFYRTEGRISKSPQPQRAYPESNSISRRPPISSKKSSCCTIL